MNVKPHGRYYAHQMGVMADVVEPHHGVVTIVRKRATTVREPGTIYYDLIERRRVDQLDRSGVECAY